MSIAGIRSNRGDSYQTLVAFEWALTVLSDPEFQWIEVDSADCLVDDVVIGKADGTQICCQCKKNQIDFKAWTIADLTDELEKAFCLLANNPKAEVRFYSRNPFGALAKIREHSTTQACEASYRTSLSREHRETDLNLSELLATHAPNLSTYEFLRRTKFDGGQELDRMETLLHERLRLLATNPKAAYDAIWRHLDQLGSRMNDNGVSATTQHRLTKTDLLEILQRAGAMLAPIMSVAEVRASFASTSAIGRSWHRDIAGHRISNPVLHELLAAIDAGKRAILLTGMPGSGKTCVILELQEALEQRAQTCENIAPLFIQSREFADLDTAQDRQAQGLPEQWVEKAARMADGTRVVVVIDSLDVLSIAREHRVLKYFLAQIDRLLLIPNITVVTACRDFDRHYDRQIAERKWDSELKCQPFSWKSQITPLFDALGIDTATIDSATRELIGNPRELALFVELARREGSFNIVTSQALAQRYLDSIVRANNALGEEAIKAIEAIASEMLKSRSLAVPHQRFTASQDIQRVLCSLNVLQETQDGKLTFGHQTLLDVLVISGAIRQGVTLNEFIQRLSPVPFVRPSIRSFVSQLATSERREFRKQLRAVLTGNAAFHLRRLVAETFAEQIPQDDDWPLIRDLRNQHREVFQVIYTQAVRIEWHHFWLKHLVPVLKGASDAEGLMTHAHQAAYWKKEDAAGVLKFWMETLSLDWFDRDSFAVQLGLYLSQIPTEDLAQTIPLLDYLLSVQQQEHSFLGRVVARGVMQGVVDDSTLWRYITGGVSDGDVHAHRFNDNLRCRPHEFGEGAEKFLIQRMEKSTGLLDLALGSIERWSQTQASHLSATRIRYRTGFLGKTSWGDIRSPRNHGRVSSEQILMGAVEAAILNHARAHSVWWQQNCERLCFSNDGALRYFAILAFNKNIQTNIDLIGRMLCDKELLKSDLLYELGTLIGEAFIYFDASVQDTLMQVILCLLEEKVTEKDNNFRILKRHAELISVIPCHLRSFEIQVVIDFYKKTEGVLIREPSIAFRGGIVAAPFSFEIILGVSDNGILRLLAHYEGYLRNSISDFLVGGEEEVGWQLREAAARHPVRFLRLLSTHWTGIPERFCDDIMDGVANYLSYSHGELKPNDVWTPIDEVDATILASDILDELERHPNHWRLNRSASNALQACSYVVSDTQHAAQLVWLAIGFSNFREESAAKEDSVDLLATGINMVSGNVIEALMILVNKLQENDTPFPELLSPTLRRFAENDSPAIRALILRRLPYLQSLNPEFGWDLFRLAMRDAAGLWQSAEQCLYYAYHKNFEKISPLLLRIRSEGSGKDFETWGRISALAAMTRHIDFDVLLKDVIALESAEGWLGVATVWTHSENIKQHRNQCLTGIKAGLSADNLHAAVMAQQMDHVFHDNASVIDFPIELIRACFAVFENDDANKHHRLIGFDEWLNFTSYRDSGQALAAIEIYLAYVRRVKPYFYDHENRLAQLITRLFAEAEEREESDNGAMLQRVVSVQDTLLSLGVDSINKWLRAAERP